MKRLLKRLKLVTYAFLPNVNEGQWRVVQVQRLNKNI